MRRRGQWCGTSRGGVKLLRLVETLDRAGPNRRPRLSLRPVRGSGPGPQRRGPNLAPPRRDPGRLGSARRSSEHLQGQTTTTQAPRPTEGMRGVPARTGPESHGSVINPVMPSTRRDDFAPGHHRGANCAGSTPARSAPAPTGGVTDPLRLLQTASAAVLTLVARGRQITTSPRDRGAKRWLAVVDPLLGPQGDARLHRIMTLHLVWLWV